MLLLTFFTLLLTNYNTTIQVDYFENKCSKIINNINISNNTNFANTDNNITFVKKNYDTIIFNITNINNTDLINRESDIKSNTNRNTNRKSNTYKSNKRGSKKKHPVFNGCGCSSWPYNTIYATNKICENISNYDNCCLELMKTSNLTYLNNNQKCNLLNSSVYYYVSCSIEPILKEEKKVNVKNIVCFTFIGLVILSIVSTILVVSVTECKEKLRRRRIRQKDIELNTIMLENELYEDDEDEVLLF